MPINKKALRRFRSKGRKARRAGGKPPVSSAFAQKVMAVVQARNESKQAFHTLAPTDFNSGIASSGDALRIIPNISQGVADNQRVGDQINPQSLTIRGIVQMLPQNGTQGDGVRKIAARVMIVTPKAYNTWASAFANATTWQAYLLKKGGTTTNFSGAIDDLYAPINTDAITCHYNKVHYFNQSTYMAVGGSTSGTVAATQDKLVHFFKKTIRFGKTRKFKYDANVDSGLTPSSGPAYVMLVGYCFVDGGAPDTISTRIRMQYDTILNYEDA